MECVEADSHPPGLSRRRLVSSEINTQHDRFRDCLSSPLTRTGVTSLSSFPARLLRVLPLCCAFALLMPPRDAEAQLLVSGRVAEEASGASVPGADVTLTDSLARPVARAMTDDAGRFRMLHPGPGTYEVSVDRIGYIATFVVLTLQDRVAAEIDITVTVLPIELDPIRVTAEQRLGAATLGFEGLAARRRMGLGDFIDREEIERRMPSMTSDLLIGGLGVFTARDGDIRFMSTTRLGGSCAPAIWVDGLLVRSPGRSYTLDEIAPSPRDIEAIELYRRPAGVPVQYNIDALCGVILIWTRR